MSKKPPNLPNIWGEGQLLAFSGLDGHTDNTQPFVLQTDTEPGHLRVRLPFAASVAFADMPPLRFERILGDAIVAHSAHGPYCAAFLDHHTLIGEMPSGASLAIQGQPMTDTPQPAVQGDRFTLYGVARGRRWALLLVPKTEGAQLRERAQAALAADREATVAARSAYVCAFATPSHLSPDRERLLRKAISVMKVNVEAPCGRMRRRWTTPDRWPHRHMWLWDSAFHGIGFSFVDANMAKDAVLAMLEQVQEDGRLPHMVPAVEPVSEITQPPLLGWAALTILKRTEDAAWAKECLPYLWRYLEWIRQNRDQNRNALPEWHIQGAPLCRSGESGMDNSPRFDGALLLDAPDFAAYLCSDYRCLAEIARYVGDTATEQTATSHAEHIAAATNALLWSDKDSFYMDRQHDGAFIAVKAVSGFMPLFAGIAPPDRAEALRQHLANPETFAAAVPIPTVSLDSGLYSKDMWRGPTWMNLNYLVYTGLHRYGFHEEAERLREVSLATVQKWYEREGCLWEFFDSLGITSPRLLDRKQRLISGRGIAPISDYHWTAATTAAWLMEA